MAQDDDPEARIRDLERSLEDQARTSEGGGAQTVGYDYPPTPPPAPPNFNPRGYPQSGFPQGQGGISPKVVVLVVAAFLGFLAVGLAVMLVVFAQGPSDVGPTSRPPSSALASPADDITRSDQSTSSSVPSTPHASSVPSIATQAPIDSGEKLVFFESGTFACNDREALVSGVSLNVVITGHCADLRVTGQDIKVTVDSADKISVSGVNSEVVYHSGTPSTDAAGWENVIRQG